MYLAEIKKQNRTRFLLRKSVYDESRECYTHHQIFDLGEEPNRYIQEQDSNIIFFDEAMEDAVASVCDEDPTLLLEKLLFKFLPAEVQYNIQRFRRYSRKPLKPLSKAEHAQILAHVHMFDRRRLYFIRYGAVDQSRIYRVNEKLYKPLLYKCRDEIEYYFRELELSLSSSEYKKYVYVIFNLQKRFGESFSSFMPEALPQDKVDEVFVEELCKLNSDIFFWNDDKDAGSLRDHLRRYLIHFFDFSYATLFFQNDFVSSFKKSHRSFKWPTPGEQLSEDEAAEIFGEKISYLKKLNPQELVKLFRAKAKEHHPDIGGSASKFIKLQKAFEELKRTFK